jgi:hypothetical protein
MHQLSFGEKSLYKASASIFYYFDANIRLATKFTKVPSYLFNNFRKIA